MDFDSGYSYALTRPQKVGIAFSSIAALVFFGGAIVLMIWVLVKGKSPSSSPSRIEAQVYSDPKISSSGVRDQFPAGPTAPAQDGNDLVSQRYTFENFRTAALMAPTAYMRPEMQGDGLSKLGDRTDYKRWLDSQVQLEGELRSGGGKAWNEFNEGQSVPVSDAYSVVLDSNVNRHEVSPTLVRLNASQISTTDAAAASRAISQIAQAQMRSSVELPLSDGQIRAMQYWKFSKPGSEPAQRIAAMEKTGKRPLPL